ncbi:hypothetical protein Sdia_45150 [Streptomyces diastaticus subsp. diastaticus]|uniref:Uncharacterized protein n=2 Tax=Streptomyces diastaticus group TaxID=2849069 RepID=A0ABQ1CTU3_STRDI|nr:hypothetical protein Sdia_45150 [Streptomyces diastaticus subsp. diastaticus]GGU07491.1 hypothetical protein GCM10015534_06830 [Streptomyces diastaticus subsp. diastaticus]
MVVAGGGRVPPPGAGTRLTCPEYGRSRPMPSPHPLPGRDTSYWMATAPGPERPSLTEDIGLDVAVAAVASPGSAPRGN